MVTPFSQMMLKTFPYFDRGIMAVAGGLFDQPNIVIEAMEFLRPRMPKPPTPPTPRVP